ncbi:MAG TPA: TetR/AcrR family transcriptional regulator [Candidatus Sulfobium mesophilum]|jgi:AcrR family transcriptional regulator|nr:TetR/AcrR family transcriptional regulator [Candidatus Sulfobium mesophilum]
MTKDTKEKILDAGLTLFSKKGYIGATTKEIARKAGVAELTLFRHFSSKERLFEEAIKRRSFLPALKGLLPALKTLTYTDALTEIALRYLERLAERRELIKIMHSEIHLYPAKVREIHRNFVGEIVGTLASYFRGLQYSSMLRKFDPEIAARAFLGMFFSYFTSQEFMAEKKQRFSDKDEVVAELVKIFVSGTAITTKVGDSDESERHAH